METERLCPHCGRPYPPKLVVTGTVRRRIVDIIASAPDGIHRDQIIWRVYGHDPNGGPLSLNIVAVIVHHANKQLRSQGYKIEAPRGRGALYRLVRINADTKRKPARHHNAAAVEGNQPTGPARLNRRSGTLVAGKPVLSRSR